MLTQTPPIVQLPTNVSPAAAPQDAAAFVIKTARPFAGIAAIAVISAVAGYFVPKVLDRWAGQPRPYAELDYDE